MVSCSLPGDEDYGKQKPVVDPYASFDSQFAELHAFGLSRPFFDTINNVVNAIHTTENFPEGVMFKILKPLGSSDASYELVKRMLFASESGKKIDSHLLHLRDTPEHAHTFALIKTFAILYRRRAMLRIFTLPAYYVENQIEAIRMNRLLSGKSAPSSLSSPSNHQSDNLQDIPAPCREILYCPVCLGFKNYVRETFSGSYIFGADTGCLNLRRDVDLSFASRRRVLQRFRSICWSIVWRTGGHSNS